MSWGHHHGTHRGTFVTEPQPNDVLMGRGAPISDNAGNIRFLALVRERCSDYKRASSRKEKDAIARQIVCTIHARNGLFLRRVDSPEEELQLGIQPGVMPWTVADTKTVLIKIKQALRDRGLEEERDQHQAGQQQAENARAGEIPSNMDDQVLGMDVVVAPHASAARRSMSEPARVPGADINTFHSAPDNIMQQYQQFPLQTNFAQGPLHHGIAHSQPSFQAPTPHLPQQGQHSTMRHVFPSLPLAANTNFQFAGEGNFSTASTAMNPAAFHHGPTGLIQPPFVQLPHRPNYGQDWNTINAAAGLNLLSDTTNANRPQQQLEGERLNAYFRTADFPQDATTEMKGGELKTDQNLAAKSNNNNNDTSGEIALQIACDVSDMGQTPIGGGVKLDPIELCLLSVLISRGLPTRSSTQFRNNDEIIYNAIDNNTPCPLTWIDVGNHLVEEVQSFLSHKPFPIETPIVQGGSTTTGFMSCLVSMASAYSKNPTNLARTTVMLLEKLRLQGGGQFASNTTAAGAASSSSTTTASVRFPGLDSFGRRSASMISDTQSGSSLAARAIPAAAAMGGGGGDCIDIADSAYGISTFFSKELGQWASSLNVADDVGFPVPYSSRDLVAHFPQFAQNDVFSTAAVLDASGCMVVLSQVSLLTRLRLIFQNNSSDQMISILRTSPAPRWGTSIEETALIDMSLLQALLVNGFSALMDLIATSDDLLGILLRRTSITKIDVEMRAVQLTCLLHEHFQSRRLNQITNEQGARIVEMIGL